VIMFPIMPKRCFHKFGGDDQLAVSLVKPLP
jgi:hypothetical protein